MHRELRESFGHNETAYSLAGAVSANFTTGKVG